VPYLYLAAGVWIAAFLEAFCWTRTGERQASALRRKYLRAVLRQDSRFFDTRGTHIAEVVNSVYNDTLVVQDTLSEKVSISCMKSSIFDGLESRILELNVFVPCYHPKMDVELMYFTLLLFRLLL